MLYDEYNNLLTKDPLFKDTVQSSNTFSSGAAASSITSGELTGNLIMADGYMQSGNFVTTSTGWKIDKDGNAEFNDGTFRGTLEAAIIKNSTGTIVIDDTGLTSTTNFLADQASAAPTITTTSTSFVDISGSTMASFTLTRSVNVFINVSAIIDNTDFFTDGYWAKIGVIDSVDGELINLVGGGTPITGGVEYPSLAAISGFATLSAGTHTLKLQWCVDGGGTAELYFWGFGYLLLGN